MAVDAYLSRVKKLRQAVRERAQRKSNAEVLTTAAADDQRAETTKLRQALDKLRGRDRIGVASEGVAVAGSAAAGAALASGVAGAAGASTLLGSTTLAGWLGGVFVTATPIGWVLGSAVVAGAAGYGAVKLIRSGGKQDRLRAEATGRLSTRLVALEQGRADGNELGHLLHVVLEAGTITPEAAQRMIALVDQGRLSPELALLRLRALGVESGALKHS